MRKLLTSRNDEYLAVFICKINFAVSRYRRSTKTAANHGKPLAINLLTRFQVVGVEGAVVCQHVKNAFVDQWRRHVRTASRPAPNNRIAAGLSFRQSKIAACACFDHEYRP